MAIFRQTPLLKNFQMTGPVLFAGRQKTNLKKLYKVFNCVFNNISYLVTALMILRARRRAGTLEVFAKKIKLKAYLSFVNIIVMVKV